MKDSGKILRFFLGVVAVCWNPVTFYLFYSDDLIYHSRVMKILFWIFPLALIGLIFFLRKKQLSSRKQNYVFGLAFFAFIFAVLVMINSLVGLFIAKEPTSVSTAASGPKGLLFEPNSAARYKTTEFEYTAQINSLGLRNREITVEKPAGVFRLLCFGDSWTFGWGTALETSWPMQLENYLKEKGFSQVEVINCGRAGLNPTFYEQQIAEIVPLLKPDMVLVGVLQLDDLAQCYEKKFPLPKNGGDQSTENQSASGKFSVMVKEFVRASFSNIIAMIQQGKAKTGASDDASIDVSAVWAGESGEIISKMNKVEQLHYNTLSDTVRSMFREGNLNPGLLNYFMYFADRNIIFNNPEHPATKFAMDKMSLNFAGMKKTCEANQSGIVFLNLPLNIFTGHYAAITPDKNFNIWLEEHNHIDSLYRSVAEKNGIPYCEMTEAFRNLTEKGRYFFRFDGHPNAEGYGQIAANVGDFLMNQNLIKK